MAKLNDKQEMFCNEYLIDLNATQAAIRAGYSKSTANRIGSENLSKLDIQERIKELIENRKERCEVDADDILLHLDILRKSRIDEYIELVETEVCIDEVNEIYKTVKTLEFKSFNQLTEEQLMCIESIKDTKNGIELKLHGKDWTIEKINKHIGFYEKDNEQSKNDVIVNNIDLSKLDSKTLLTLKKTQEGGD